MTIKDGKLTSQVYEVDLPLGRKHELKERPVEKKDLGEVPTTVYSAKLQDQEQMKYDMSE